MSPKLKLYFLGITALLTGAIATGGCTTPQSYASDETPRFNYNSIEDFKQSLNNHIDDWALSVNGQAVECLEDSPNALTNNNLQNFYDYDQRIAFDALKYLSEDKTLGLRIVKNMPAALLDEVIAQGLHTGSGSKWLSIGGIKVFMDGALGARTASMLEPYELDTNNYGIVVTKEDELLSIANKANIDK